MVRLLTNRTLAQALGAAGLRRMALFSPEAVAPQWAAILSGFARRTPNRQGRPSMNTHSG
jgi:hypothetical protein